jgi:beta-xylosidase
MPPPRQIACLALVIAHASLLASPPAKPDASWLPDRGDGTYSNPILYADYSDPDVVRVGDDYWMTASSFGHVPALPILHSRDLVNWELVNYALPRLVPADHYAQPRHGCGVWAPAIRYHDGRYWIYYPDPDFGIYVITATDPAGRWSEPVLVKAGKGLIDPCPLWDDNGQVYLIHAWARSRSGRGNLLTLLRLSPDGTRPLDEGTDIIDANLLPGWVTLEGPKIYKRDGWYWIFAPAGGVPVGYQAVFRSRQIAGPYENRIVLDQGSTPINGPHQGAWVDTPSGEHWFLHFQEKLPWGRIVHLQPMQWRTDGWPVMGIDASGTGKGEPVLAHRKPALPAQPVAVPPTTDEFDAPGLGLQWQWQANPQPGWASLTAAPGSLRLACVSHPVGDNLWTAGHLLLQKFPAPTFTAETELRLAPAAPGDSAGLIVFGYDYAWIGVRQTAAGPQLVRVDCLKSDDTGKETVTVLAPLPQPSVRLRVAVDAGGLCRFSYSLDGTTYVDAGAEFQSTRSRWVGAKAGLHATTTAVAGASARPAAGTAAQPSAPAPVSGAADFAWFRVSP